MGYTQVPVGFVYGVPIDDQLRNMLLAVEESFIVAALNKAAKTFRNKGSIKTKILPRTIRGQISYKKTDVPANLLNTSLLDIEGIIKQKFPGFSKEMGS